MSDPIRLTVMPMQQVSFYDPFCAVAGPAVKTIKQLYKLSDGLKGDLNEVLEELLKEKERKIEELPLHLEEYHGIYIKKSQEKDQQEQAQEIVYPIDEKDKEELLSNAYANYEKRSGQFRMMDIVYHSFQNEQHAVIEAGTGVGKSLAYLLPAVYTAILIINLLLLVHIPLNFRNNCCKKTFLS